MGQEACVWGGPVSRAPGTSGSMGCHVGVQGKIPSLQVAAPGQVAGLWWGWGWGKPLPVPVSGPPKYLAVCEDYFGDRGPASWSSESRRRGSPEGTLGDGPGRRSSPCPAGGQVLPPLLCHGLCWARGHQASVPGQGGEKRGRSDGPL